MRFGFYSKLALGGIRKNKKLYLPYILTCILMVAIYYILGFLYQSDLLENVSGGSSARLILMLGTYVIAVFAVLFLFYTNSFLMRRRKKEFGLYNVLGMDKRSLCIIMFYETAFVFVVSFASGIAAGIALSKLSELSFMHLISGEIGYGFEIPLKAVKDAAIYFAIIFFVIYLNEIRQIRFTSTINLVKSENLGEKAPRSNVFLGVAGALILAAAYYMAVAIEQPLQALTFFFIAVLMVILATYILFIAGSVLMCRILQKNKRYYYRPEHFVSVSSMTYRMKRNGAGLASICILLTMVLVMVSSSASLYFGKDAALDSRYPRDICAYSSWYGYDEKIGASVEKLNEAVIAALREDEMTEGTLHNYMEYSITGAMENGNISLDMDSIEDISIIDYNEVVQVHFLSLDDYNRTMGMNETLKSGEALVCEVKTSVADEFSVGDVSIKVKDRLDYRDLDFEGATMASVTANLIIVTDDIDRYAARLADYKDYNGNSMLLTRWFFEFDTPIPEEKQAELCERLTLRLEEEIEKINVKDSLSCYTQSHDLERADFYASFGSLFYIGILLSLVFMVAAALIIYYKQICEGYEDKAGFDIMKKVGMTNKDIKKSINSQMLTVFLLPIIAAVLHLCFAFPFENKLMALFGLADIGLLFRITLISALICAVIYLVIYRITSVSYYDIVAGNKENG